MNRRAQSLSLLVLLVAPMALALDSSEANEAASWDRYRMLSERNIFVRDRGGLPESKPVTEQTVRAIDDDDSDRYLLLTATVQRGREGIAFVEDTRSGETVKVRTGHPIGKGKLVKITLGHVEYEREGTTTRIEIGSSLAGLTVSPVSTATAASPEPDVSTDPDKPTNATDGDTSAILERMRRRREQEAKE